MYIDALLKQQKDKEATEVKKKKRNQNYENRNPEGVSRSISFLCQE